MPPSDGSSEPFSEPTYDGSLDSTEDLDGVGGSDSCAVRCAVVSAFDASSTADLMLDSDACPNGPLLSRSTAAELGKAQAEGRRLEERHTSLEGEASRHRADAEQAARERAATAEELARCELSAPNAPLLATAGQPATFLILSRDRLLTARPGGEPFEATLAVPPVAPAPHLPCSPIRPQAPTTITRPRLTRGRSGPAHFFLNTSELTVSYERIWHDLLC